ncbi:PEP-CTERM domain-containing protein [Rubrivivax sp. A210]|uniref:PEP-CTERM sorting domain-containing protein n=1 Tax=Rubrivivax sp. A210 TaxID=2772301 RepID=UPI0019199A17|nr:PEP-CTERM sorting domain-containing protein [Rubrivivax sp. A210]CAD5372073.1 PEP-CTERM domain-containing protein [Rubrivivax sp. A210]
MRLNTLTLAAALLAASQLAAAANVSSISENFEGTLSHWTDRSVFVGGAVQSAIVVDPLNAANHALGFNRTFGAGSLFSVDTISTTTGQFTVNFDYLGLAKAGSVAGNLGGFFGISQGFPGTHDWIAGTLDGFRMANGVPVIGLVDDGQWHHYSLTFNTTIGNTVHLMFEDYDGSGGVAGDVFFDNIQFNDSSVAALPLNNVPEPGSLALLGAAALAAAAVSRKRQA